MRVALVVDNPLRDLPGLVLVARSLCERGATCYLVPMYFLYELWSLAPDLVLLNYLRPNNEDLARQLMDAGIVVGVHDTEGGVVPDVDLYSKIMSRDADVRQRVSFVCVWGPKVAEVARSVGTYCDEQLVVTGTARYDFYQPPWRKAALENSPYANGFPLPLVLINGTFPLCNPGFQTPEEEVRMLVEKFSFDPKLTAEWQRAAHRAMCGLAELTNNLARRFPHVSFIYRPHPFERVATYETLLEKLPNLHLLKVGSVDGWMLRASAVIQRSCSTVVDAGMIGIPALLPAWLPVGLTVPVYDELSVGCESEEMMAGVLESIFSGNYLPPSFVTRRLDEVISDWYYAADGLAHERIADCIMERANGSSRVDRLGQCRNFARSGGWGTVKRRQRVRDAVIKRLGLPPDWSFRKWKRMGPGRDLDWWLSSEKYFSAEQVAALVRALDEAESEGQVGRQVRVRPAREGTDYLFGRFNGQSVTVSTE